MFHAAVTQDAFGFQDMMTCAAIDKGMGAAGIVAEHAAYAATVACGGLGTEEESVRFQGEVEFVEDDARLHPCPAFFSIDFQDLLEMFADVDHYAAAHHLSSDGGSSRSRYEMGLSL